MCALAAVLSLTPMAEPQVPSAAESRPDVTQLLRSFAGYAPDPCGLEQASEKDWHSFQIEDPLFDRVADLVADALNTEAATPSELAKDALRLVERASDEANAAWPKENRFRFEILDLKEVLVVELSIRTHGRFFVFGVPQTYDGKPNQLWRRITLIEDSEREVPGILRALYSLHRGPSGKPRFLVRTIWSGCAGSLGVSYEAHEWSPEDYGSADKMIGVEGSLGLDDRAPGFPQIGKFQTNGALIDLPYCWRSAIDTWDNPSLCAVDRYDLSGDSARFVSRQINRPDLLPIAKAIEYAEKRDFPAVRAYCANDSVARRLVELAPGHLFEVEIKAKQLSAGRESVSDGGGYRFIVEKQGQRWLVAGFSSN
jgi:hypothetical protein